MLSLLQSYFVSTFKIAFQNEKIGTQESNLRPVGYCV